MSISFKPTHLSRYKDIAWLLFKYGRGELVDAAGLDDGGNHNGHAVPGESLRLLSEVAPDEKKFYAKGAKEVEEKIGKKRIK